MITVGIAGAAGRMGRALVRAVAARPDLRLTRAWERTGHPAAGQDAGVLASLDPLGVPLTVDERPDLAGCQVVIDLTTPAATAALAPRAAAAGCAWVVGTTGLDAAQLELLRSASARVPVLHATNFSLGVNLLWKLARLTAAALGEDYDIEIIEAHHNQKQDAPSGTAVTLYEEVCRGRGLDPAAAARHGRHGQVGARTRTEVGLHAVRGGDIVGDHTVLFAGPGERLELRHQVQTRDTLAQGAVRAAAWLAGRPAGWYRMADVLGLNALD